MEYELVQNYYWHQYFVKIHSVEIHNNECIPVYYCNCSQTATKMTHTIYEKQAKAMQESTVTTVNRNQKPSCCYNSRPYWLSMTFKVIQCQ